MKRFTITTFPLENKTIFLRVDYNVPLEKGKVKDNTRIKASLDTIHFLLSKGCKIVMATHLGRPEGKVVDELKVNPLVKELKKLLPKVKITKTNDTIGKKVKKEIKNLKSQQILFLENLRFYCEENENDLAFAHSLAEGCEVYINEAFGVCHRKNASINSITTILPSIAGFQLEKEIFHLSKVLKAEKPLIWVMGGAKLQKIDLMKQALDKAEYVLIGGALPFSFLRAMNIPIGMSKIDCGTIDVARQILENKRWRKKLILPIDYKVSKALSSRSTSEIVKYNNIQNNQIALDLGPESITLFKRYVRKGKTIVWNGPLGYYEWHQFATATKEVGKTIAQLTATTIIGGGETSDAINRFHLRDKMNHVSTGGGATLSFLSGKKLQGIIALEKNYQKFSKTR
ncbi:phosphoglycerate kinase [Candidatus Woesearchaeota archaeon]|jgi:phosphoglycerate kinase|nr:phosphoglycerate kinase [Candidatus Woesearchaeota archaeon]MBT4151030.1 phosphoglycerate kinase [Candidatus Woesearchaeota archaeon]MBT4247201.1 phosphoglycerate kinase [Candidatus Woesearchaeota archaeon]MBT4433820.1 phosphoglycerate kinase [Candidatus Woesearchaeota archaeon]MBT7332181.1 phosphoglycerate kinase [Candidatus Woesearchaeota archaeon]